MVFPCSTAVVYISLSDTVSPTDSFGHICFSLSVEFLSMCGMPGSQIQSTKPATPHPLHHSFSRYFWGINSEIRGIPYVLMWP